jgi:hypothetical protein
MRFGGSLPLARIGPLTVTYDSNVFQGGAVALGRGIWLRNTFRGCRLIVDALPADWVGNNVHECQFEFLPNGITPLEFADWVQPKEPGLADALRKWVAKGGWKPPTLH